MTEENISRRSVMRTAASISALGVGASTASARSENSVHFIEKGWVFDVTHSEDFHQSHSERHIDEGKYYSVDTGSNKLGIGGNAPDYADGNAWEYRSVGFVGTGYLNTDNTDTRADRMKIIATHETLHGYINKGPSAVQDLIADGANEHSLGQVHSDTSKASPLVASYASGASNTYAETGQCSDHDPIDWGDWSSDLTDCTTSALDHCYEYAKAV